MGIDDLCIFKEMFTTQLAKEQKQYNTDEGVKGYRDQGCDKCDGTNKLCDKYLPNKDI